MGKKDEEMMEMMAKADAKRKAGAVVHAKVKPLTSESWARFGEVLEIPTKAPVLELPFVKFWNSVLTYEVQGGVADIGVATVTREREGMLPMLERHHATEVTVPIDGDMIVAVGPAGDLADAGEKPDPAAVEVFYVRQNQTFTMKPGVWHWAPWSLGPKSVSMLVLLTHDTFHKDMDMRELEQVVIFEVQRPQ
jgi:ureidoglycolate lyase